MSAQPDYVPADVLTTPTQYAKRRAALKTMRAAMRAAIARIRALRASVAWVDVNEEAPGAAEWFGADTWPRYRRAQAWLRVMVPVKDSHISPRAAARRDGGAA